MKVVVTREAGTNDVLVTWLAPDSTVEEVPLTTTSYSDRDDVRTALESSAAHGAFRTLVVTSERSVGYVDIALAESATDADVCCVGPATADALNARGVSAHAVGEGTADTLAQYISKGPVLMLGAKSMRGELASSLLAKGLEVVTVACYETIGLNLDTSDATKVRAADVLFIGAPSAWTVAREFVSKNTWVVVPGATTAAAVNHDHYRVIEGWGPDLATRLAELPIAE